MAQQPLLRDASPEELEAFVQIVVLVAFADGDLSEVESKLLVDRVDELTDGRVESSHMKELMVELPPLSRGTNNWRADRIKTLKVQLEREDLRDAAFALAVDVARADNGIGLREGRMLVNVVAELGISSEYAQSLLKGSES